MAKKAVHKNIILVILALAQFMVVLDVSVMNVALPAIYKTLHFSTESNLQWVVTAYTLAFGGFLLLGGRAADLFGRKKLFLSAVTMFVLASFTVGLSQNSEMIIIARAIQGLSAAFMSPAALSLILTTFKEGNERNRALSIWGAVAAGGAAAGVLLGGILTQYLSWRWNFFINIPVGLLVVITASLYITDSKADLDHKQLDLPGAVLVTSGLMLLVYGLTQAPSYGWSSHKTIELLGGSILLLVLFAVNETKSKHPLVPFSIFKIRNLLGANLTQLPVQASLFSMFFFLTLYVQDVLGFSPVKTGLSFLPVTIIIGVIASRMSHVIARIGYKIPLVIAPLLLASGLFILAHVPVNGNYWHDVFPGLVIMAMGLGMVFVSITIAATSGVQPKESGLASGLLNTSQQIGGSIGLAILSGVATSKTASYIAGHTNSNVPSQLVQARGAVEGFHSAFYVGVGFALLAFVIALTVIRHKKGDKLNTTKPIEL